MSTQRKSSRCSRKVLTGPPSASSGRSGSLVAGHAEKCPAVRPWAGWKAAKRSGRAATGAVCSGFVRLGGRLGRRVLDFVRHFARRLFEFLDALAQTAGQFGNFLGAEQKQDGQNHDDPFPCRQKSCKHGIHKFCRASTSLRPFREIVKRQKRPRVTRPRRKLCGNSGRRHASVRQIEIKPRSWDAAGRNRRGGFSPRRLRRGRDPPACPCRS